MSIMILLLALILVIGSALFYNILFGRLLRLIPKLRESRKIRLWAIIPSGVMIAFLLTMHGYRFLIAMMLFLIGMMIEVMVQIVRFICHRMHRHLPRLARLHRTGLVTIAIAAIIIVCGCINIRDVRVKEYSLTTNKEVPNGEMTIAMVSDLHLNNSLNADEWHPYIEKLQQMNPDIVVLVGDIFDEHTKKEDLKKVAADFGRIESTYGTYYVGGNHEGYASTSMGTLRNAGIHVMLDERADVDEHFTVVGRVDRSIEMAGGSRLSMKELMYGANPDAFTLVLDHQPVGINEAKDAGADLQLSGHTHDGQILLMKLAQPILPFNDVDYGYKKDGNYQIVVSSGASGWGFPYRMGSHSEIVKITIRSN